MELRHLRYFVAVAEERNFTRAAERLHIAQPPLSRQIHQLEDLLKVPLFVRGVRPLELTEAGRFFYGHAVQLLARSEEIVALTRKIGNVERRLAIGFVGSTLFGLLPEVVRRFKAAHPETEVALEEMSSLEQVSALKEGVIDVGIGRSRHPDPKIRRIVLREESLVAALPLGHPLSEVTRGLKLRELANETLIVFPKAPRPSFADEVLNAFHDRGLEPAQVNEARGLQVALGLVAVGMGIAIVPQSVQGLKRSDLCHKTLDEENLSSPIVMSLRTGEKSEEIQSMLQLIRSVYRAMGVAHVQEGG